MLRPVNLRCEYLYNPECIDVRQPRLSWILESEQRGQVQSAYRILVADRREALEADNPTLWDSGRVGSGQSTHVLYAGEPLRSGMQCWWKVRVWDRHGTPSAFSLPAQWQMGLLDPFDWQARWIWLDTGTADEMGMKPCAYLRRELQVTTGIQRAVLYATARGLYELHVNGNRVGDAVLSPGWTDYYKRIQYQAYDITAFLNPGSNAIGVILGDGWYYGHVGHKRGRSHYGPQPQILAQLRMEYLDGNTNLVFTDETWKGSSGPILYADLLMGEAYDARAEMPEWDRPGFDDAEWQTVQTERHHGVPLVADRAPPTRVTQEIEPQSVTLRADGTQLFDLGQNMVGWVRLRVQGEPGTTVHLRFAEVLNPDGSIHTDNLRSARATDTYILEGGGTEVFEPHFTFHGFRYVEVMGYPDQLPLDAITGCVVHSDLLHTGTFECSSPTLNRLWQNILWSQRGNFVSVPSDCPQRDERLGWMGDAHLFARTACLNMDAAPFFTKWMVDVADAQSPAGAFSDVAPRLVVLEDGAPAWGDAGIIVPWTVYQIYGDRQIIAQHYEAMARWMNYIHEANPHLLRTKRLGKNYGDWVAFDNGTSKEMLATAYWAYDARLMSAMARAIGKAADAQAYQALFEGIKDAFITAYVHPDGRIEGGTQTAYVLALHMDLLPAHLQAVAARHLVEAIERENWHLSTGFIGTAYLCPVLAEHGYTDAAYRLLRNETCPSWGYMVRNGATTIWERWNSWTAEEGLHESSMNSFNHYALGSVGEWLYRYVAGIDTDPHQPGYQHIIIRPRPGGGLSYATAELQTMYGPILSEWRIQKDALRLTISIPANTTATVYVPAARSTTVTESGQPVAQAEGVSLLRQAESAHVFNVGSGTYHFVAESHPSERRRTTP